jgi:hypothetical protein
MRVDMTETNGKAATIAPFDLPWLPPEPEVAPKDARRELKRQLDEATQPLDGWQQYRVLWDGIDFKRQLINMGDKKARFALVIMGALNAILLIILTRGPVIRVIPDGVRPWLVVLLVLYGVVTFGFVVYAIEALRPQPESGKRDEEERGSPVQARAGQIRLRWAGLFLRGSEHAISYAEEHQLWSNARMGQLHAELILMNRSATETLERQYRALHRVYQGLKLLAVLSAMIMALLVGVSVVRGGQDVVATAGSGDVAGLFPVDSGLGPSLTPVTTTKALAGREGIR